MKSSSPPMTELDAAEHSWTALQSRLHPGDKLTGVVEKVVPFGVFVQLDEEFLGFLDPLELGESIPNVGDRIDVEITGFTQRNHQIRLAPRDSTAEFFEAIRPVEASAIAQLDRDILEFKVQYESFTSEKRQRFRAWLEKLVEHTSRPEMRYGEFHVKIQVDNTMYDDAGNVVYTGGCSLAPRTLLIAIDAWDKGEQFAPQSLWRLVAGPIPKASSHTDSSKE